MTTMTEKAQSLAKETGLPVRYSFHGGICLSRGAVVRTDLDATPEAVQQAWDEMGESFWNKPDTAISSTGGSYWDEED